MDSSSEQLSVSFRMALKTVERLNERFDPRLHGGDFLPETGALLVGNHSLLGVDTMGLLPLIYRHTGRVPRALAFKALFDVPGAGKLLREIGMVPGERGVAVEMLQEDEIVVVYPGGVKDSMKGRTDRYGLFWEGRKGFAAVSIESQRPIIPVAAIGPDEVFPTLSKSGIFPLKMLGKTRIPLALPFARRVHFDYFLGEPIQPPSREEGATKEGLNAYAREVQESLERLITEGLELGRGKGGRTRAF